MATDLARKAKFVEQKSSSDAMTYLETQAEMGVTKHIGGWEATRELWRLCRLHEAREVLEVGCGVGVGPANIAKEFACRVVATDISEKMLEWARQRARSLGVADRIEFRQADVRSIPFDDNRFDAVIAESVVSFVDDKVGALAELRRVARPGGYVGVNEGIWLEPPPAEAVVYFKNIAGTMCTAAEYSAFLSQAGLTKPEVRVRRVELGRDVRDRAAWLGTGWMLRSAGRMLRLLITEPSMRKFIKEAGGGGALSWANYMGYGLFVGRK
jgi:ubiquinone/menaquinone biosynthesis C-methylase UbiE